MATNKRIQPVPDTRGYLGKFKSKAYSADSQWLSTQWSLCLLYFLFKVASIILICYALQLPYFTILPSLSWLILPWKNRVGSSVTLSQYIGLPLISYLPELTHSIQHRHLRSACPSMIFLIIMPLTQTITKCCCFTGSQGSVIRGQRIDLIYACLLVSVQQAFSQQVFSPQRAQCTWGQHLFVWMLQYAR